MIKTLLNAHYRVSCERVNKWCQYRGRRMVNRMFRQTAICLAWDKSENVCGVGFDVSSKYFSSEFVWKWSICISSVKLCHVFFGKTRIVINVSVCSEKTRRTPLLFDGWNGITVTSYMTPASFVYNTIHTEIVCIWPFVSIWQLFNGGTFIRILSRRKNISIILCSFYLQTDGPGQFHYENPL